VSGVVGWALGAAVFLLLPFPWVRPRPTARAGAAATADDVDAATRVPPFFLVLAVAAVCAACVAVLGLRRGVVGVGVVGPATGVVLAVVRRRPARPTPDPALPLTLDLVAAALRSGRPLPDALARAAPAARPDVARALLQVAGLLRLGAEPTQAWAALARAGPLASVSSVAVRSATSGIKLAAAFERSAADLRAERAAAAEARAHRAGVIALAPLAACFLPSFVCLGVIPVVVGIAATVSGAVP
jgi:Flp pilus assembly protein TadB